MSGGAIPLNPNCPPGYAPDIIYRFPMEPFFPEPFGQDCGFSQLGFNVFGGILLVFAVIGLVLHLLTLPDPEKPLFTYVRLLHCADLIVMIALIVTVFVDYIHAYILAVLYSIVFMSNGVMWSYLGYQTIIKTVVNVQLKRDVNVYTLLGGRTFVYLFMAALVIGNLGVFTAAVTLAVKVSQGDYVAAALAFRIVCACIALGCALFVAGATMALTSFIGTIDASINSSMHDSNSEYVANLKDISKRFRVVRVTFFGAATGATVLFILHASILPVFWWIQLIHLAMSSGSAVALLFAITSPVKRYRIINMLSCGMCGSDALSTPTISARVQSSALAPVESAPPSTSPV